MAKAAWISVSDGGLMVVAVAAAATAATALIRWGDEGTYSLGPSLPWAYFVAATIVGLMLSSPRLLTPSGERWRTRVLATTYVAIGLAGLINLAFAIALFYSSGEQRSLHSMFVGERTLYTVLGLLIYIVPLTVTLSAGTLLLSRNASRATTTTVVALAAFTLILGVTEFALEYVVYHLRT